VAPSGIRLAVRGDDLGMAHAVNEGIAAAWTSGILTQVTVMAPCPWFAEGARVARDLGMPTAVHTTLTAEWSNLRWGPLTGATSCARRDGTFHRTPEQVAERVHPDDAVAEIDAQVARVRDAGLTPMGLDPHMGVVVAGTAAVVAERHDLPFVHGGRRTGRVDTMAMLTNQADKRAWLLAWLVGLSEGTHLLVTHPGVDGDELAALTDPEAPNSMWAHSGRVSDLAVLTDPEVLDVVAGRSIELVAAFGDGTTVGVEKA
jgi:predicted glycoside hydrolase/deacetylase ChbG (UPF0249 family)